MLIMKSTMYKFSILLSIFLIAGLILPGCSNSGRPAVTPPDNISTPSSQKWTLANPEGAYKIEPVKIASRLNSLEGKTIALRWNGKPGGSDFLDGIAERLTKEVPTAKVVKLYELDPMTATYGSSVEAAATAAKSILETYNPDLVIASQAD